LNVEPCGGACGRAAYCDINSKKCIVRKGEGGKVFLRGQGEGEALFLLLLFVKISKTSKKTSHMQYKIVC
jgi:hypothetical protein